MPIDTAEFDRDVLEATCDLPSSVIIGGVTYACLADDMAAGAQLQEIGMFDSTEATLIVRTALFAAAGKDIPKAGQLVAYNGKEYRISENGVNKSVDGFTVTLRLESKVK